VDPGPPRTFAAEGQLTTVVTLGTSTPSPNPFRLGPSGVIIVGETPYLIDAGVGVMRGLAKLAAAHDKRYMDTIAPRKLSRLFITHLHSDHVVGLPDLILSPWIFGRSEPLEIYGPPGTRSLAEKLIDAYQVDIKERIYGPEGANDTGYQVNVHEIGEGMVYHDSNIKVTAFAHEHGNLTNFGFRFETEDRTIIWAGDGKLDETHIPICSGADLMVTELCTLENLGNAPWGGVSEEEKEEIIWAYHIKPSELADFARKSEIKKLILIHESNYSKPYDPLALVDEMKNVYTGEVISARDADAF
jgi:ribonuclease Z